MKHNGEIKQLRHEIELTRGRIADEIDAIGVKLSPEHIKQAVKTKVKEATMEVGQKISETGRNVGRAARAGGEAVVASARAHPVRATAVLIGLALILGWLLSRNERVRSGARRLRAGAGSAYDTAKEKAGSAYEAAKTKVANVKERIAHRGEEATTGLEPSSTGVLPGEWYEEGKGLGGDMAGEIEHRSRLQKAGQLYHQAGERVGDVYRRTEEKIEYAWHRNPLAVGAIVFAAGFGIGLALSSTRTERRVLGPVGERLGEKARDLKQRAVHAVNESMETVRTKIEEGGKGTPEGGGSNQLP